jgi:hypothetical protein
LTNWPQREGRKKQTIRASEKDLDYLASDRGKKESDYYRDWKGALITWPQRGKKEAVYKRECEQNLSTLSEKEHYLYRT